MGFPPLLKMLVDFGAGLLAPPCEALDEDASPEEESSKFRPLRSGWTENVVNIATSEPWGESCQWRRGRGAAKMCA